MISMPNQRREDPRPTGNPGKRRDEMKTKHAYQIIVGETGNERGHIHRSAHVSDAAAIRAAKRLCAPYSGDGWWLVECDGSTVARGGRAS